MDSIAGQLVTLAWLEQAERVRACSTRTVIRARCANSDSGTGPAITIAGSRDRVRRRRSRHRPRQRRLRLQAEHHAGDRQLHLHPRRRTATSSASTGSTSTTSARRRRSSLYTFPTHRVAIWRRRAAPSPFGYTTMSQITGEPVVQHGHERVQHVRAGRLADRADREAALRRALRPATITRTGIADAPLAQTHDFNIDQNNFGPRVGVAVVARSTRRCCARSTGIMYDQAILGGYEQALQLSGSPRAPVYTFNGTTRRVRRHSRHGRSTGTLSAAVAVGGRPGLRRSRTPGRRTRRSSARSASDFTASIGVMYAKGNQLPVVTDVNLINPIGTLADGRPIYSTARQRGDAPRSALQPHQRGAVDRRVDVQVDDAAGDQALVARADVQRAVLARQGPRQHAAADAAHRAGRGGPIRSEQHRSRPRTEPARHAPQLQRQRRLHVDITRRTRSCAACSTATRSASCCSSTAACR